MQVQTLEDPLALRLEAFMASMDKLKERQEATARQMEKTDRLIEETGKQMKETDKQMKETDRKMKETDRWLSKLGSRFGEMVEHLVAPNLMQKFNELGFNYTRCSGNTKIKETGDSNLIAEIDILLENGDIAMAIEIKAKPDKDDVINHIERMEKLRKYADNRGDKRSFQAGIGAAILSEEMREFILKQGFYLIEQSGDTVHINIPRDFTPREW